MRLNQSYIFRLDATKVYSQGNMYVLHKNSIRVETTKVYHCLCIAQWLTSNI